MNAEQLYTHNSRSINGISLGGVFGTGQRIRHFQGPGHVSWAAFQVEHAHLHLPAMLAAASLVLETEKPCWFKRQTRYSVLPYFEFLWTLVRMWEIKPNLNMSLSLSPICLFLLLFCSMQIIWKDINFPGRPPAARSEGGNVASHLVFKGLWPVGIYWSHFIDKNNNKASM